MNAPFLRFASVCCFLTVITTLGIHLFFPEPPAAFEQRVLLYKNFTYLFQRWWVIVHCLLVMIAMWGFVLERRQKAAGFAGLGFVFFVVFAVTEIARQMMVLFYLNGLRVRYLAAENPAVKEILRVNLDNIGLISVTFFGLFVLAFALGNLCYGLSLLKEKGFGKVLSWLLILWALGGLTALGNEFWQIPALETGISYYNFSYQPLMRALLGGWLWLQAVKMEA